VQIAPWAQSLAETFLQQADGQRFMTVAAALAYLYDRPDGHAQLASSDDEDGDEDGRDRDDHDDEDVPPEERDDDEDARARDEAGADWLAEQGFDRKD